MSVRAEQGWAGAGGDRHASTLLEKGFSWEERGNSEDALNFLRPNPYFGRGNWALTSAFSYRNSQAAFFAFPDGFGKYK